MATDLILGAAGHIDHGKTSLVKLLTGVDTDRLPEEKRRGITIELGFAELDLGEYRLGVVDVPGHERFVRQMLAGATGVDLAMLVVAGDDSIKPQTREHLEILRLLDIQAGVIALTKCDLVEADWLDLVEAEIQELVAGSVFESAPIVRCSGKTAQGIDALRDALRSAAAKVDITRCLELRQQPARMPIDRVFSKEGHGVVVTGSVSSGSIRAGDVLRIEPSGAAARVRSVQNHDRLVDAVYRGQRAAVNLAGLSKDDVQCGRELASAGYLRSSRRFTVELHLLESAPRPLKNRARVRLHLGSLETFATVVLLETAELQPGESTFAQFHLREEAVATWRQPFVVRSESPVATIGGGVVLDPHAERLRHFSAEQRALCEAWRIEDPPRVGTGENADSIALERAKAAIYFSGLAGCQPGDLYRRAGVLQEEAVLKKLLAAGDVVEIVLSPQRVARLHRRVLEELSVRIVHALEKLHDQQPLSTWIDLAPLAQRFKYIEERPLFDAALKTACKDGRIQRQAARVALPERLPKLSRNEQKLLVQLKQRYLDAGFCPPSVAECQAKTTSLADRVPQLLKLAADDGTLVAISADRYLHTDCEQQIKELLDAAFAERGGLTLSEIRELMGNTRKYAIPICEYLDDIGFTVRNDNLRQRPNS